MIVLLWLITFVLFALCVSFFTLLLFKDPQAHQMLRIIRNGFREGLTGSGLIDKNRRKYEVELWVWEVEDEDYASDECLERATWAPMDIADWMKEGLPGTPECGIDCGEKCCCRLIRYHSTKKPHQS